MFQQPAPNYLQPYLKAAERHGGGFGSLLWASPKTQAARFAAIRRLTDFQGKIVLDAGCGRADLLDDLARNSIAPRRYIGLEAVPALAAVAEMKMSETARIIRCDFVSQPDRLIADADVIVFCGSLNTLSRYAFQTTLQAASRAAREAVVFNFLSSSFLASSPHLTWHETDTVLKIVEPLGNITRLDDYLRGDCTMKIEIATHEM